jgi:hypothetical protein
MGRLIACAAVAAALGAGIVNAHEGDGDPGRIHACVKKRGGHVRFVAADPTLRCKKSENPVHFNITGQTGPPGTPGAPGRSALTVLQSGETLVGGWGGGTTAGGAGQTHIVVASFAIPLAADLGPPNVVYVVGGSAPSCPGEGQAATGFLCVYESPGTLNAAASGVFKLNGTAGASRNGFGVGLTSAAGGLSIAGGTYAFTAP